MPWSTSAASIFIVGYVVTALGSLSTEGQLLAVLRPRLLAVAPLALGIFATIGLFWGDAPGADQWRAYQSFAKLGVIPVLLACVLKEEEAQRILVAFVMSCTALVALSLASKLFPNAGLWWWFKEPYVPVKDYIHLGTCFLTAGCGLAYAAFVYGRRRHWVQASAFGVLALLFFLTMVYVSVSRTTLLVIPMLVLVMGRQLGGSRGFVWSLFFLLAVGGITLSSSTLVQKRLDMVIKEATSERKDELLENLRPTIWRKSLAFIAQAPLFGHGTGSIRSQFATARAADSKPTEVVYANAHNQTLTIGIQLGLVGIALLFLLWWSHIAFFFSRGGWPAHLGALLVTQNIISSLANSHLSDFTSGWIYIFGVGILARLLVQADAEKDRTGDILPVGASCAPEQWSGPSAAAVPSARV